jgi:exopolysaccharide biosynthesis protein
MLIVGSHSISQLKKLGVKEAVSFGPPLVVNGKPTISRGDGGWGIAPRAAIGQREDGAVLFLVIDGRSLGSLGATLRDIQDIFIQYKAVNAVNLDGGSSATMYFNGKVINRPSDALGERAVPTVFMVVPEKGGAN